MNGGTRLVQDASADSERHFSDSLIENLPGVLYFYDEEGRFLRWNSNLERVTGYSAGEIADMHPLQLVPPEARLLVAARIREVLEKGSSSVESELLSRDGTVTPYFFTGKRVVFDGAPCLVGVGIDVSDLRRTERLLLNSESDLEKVQSIAHLGSWELDIASRTLTWSDEVFHIFGCVPGSFAPSYERFLSFVHPDDRDRMEEAQGHALKGDRELNLEHRIVRPDGVVRWVHELGKLERDAAGRAVRLLGTIHDISVHKRTQEQLRVVLEHLESKVVARTAELQAALVRAEAADRMKSAFLATMSHELRTPLNSVIGFTGILLQELAGPLNEEQARQLGMVRGSARHLLELINDVLDLSRIEAGQMQVRVEPFELPAIIERVAASLKPIADRKGIDLVTEIPAGLASMTGDRRRIEQVLINLVSNAIKFTERGSVTVSAAQTRMPAEAGASEARPAVRMRVTDTGVGIRSEDAESVFRPFHQIDGSSTRAHEGTGLGLAICKRLVALMGGTISLESSAGKGSEFSVTLPVHATSA